MDSDKDNRMDNMEWLEKQLTDIDIVSLIMSPSILGLEEAPHAANVHLDAFKEIQAKFA